MKKISKILMITLILVVAIAPMTSLLFAETVTNTSNSGGVGTDFPSSTTPSGEFVDILSTGWGLVLSICQIAAFGIIIFCGLKYMFASASEKADIKKSIGPLLIGAILVFGSTFIVTIVMAIVNTLQ